MPRKWQAPLIPEQIPRERRDPTQCEICFGTKFYIDSRGEQTNRPCNQCNKVEWQAFLNTLRKQAQ